jgi:chromosome segregation ATPase
VYGRVRDCVHVTQRTHVAAVATALRACINLSSTVITQTRAAAVACLDHVTRTKAGCVKCLIAEERRGKPKLSAERASLLASWHRQFDAAQLSASIEV